MNSATTSPIEIYTSPEEVPSIPPWFAEMVVLARYFNQQAYLDDISQRVRLARGRAGAFDLLDFVTILLGYAISGQPTLEAFFTRLAPFAPPFMAVFSRNLLPHRSTLSRFLAAIISRAVMHSVTSFRTIFSRMATLASRLAALSITRAAVLSYLMSPAPDRQHASER